MGQNRKPAALGAIVLGLFFFGAARFWESLTGANPDAADRLYLGFFQFMGAFAVLTGLVQLYRNWLTREKRRRAEQPSGVYGSSAFASLDECIEAGLTDPRGLYLGLLEGQPLFYSGKAHLLTVAPARQGKGIGVVIPNLLHAQGSVFVTDPKGELAAVTAKHRRERLGQDVFVLNPWGLHGLPQHSYNPLQPLIDAASDPGRQKDLSDEVKALAIQLLPEPESDSKNLYFREGSRRILRALMLHLATRGDPARCTLPEMWRIVNSTRRLDDTIAAMHGSDALGGVVADLGADLLRQVDENGEQFGDFQQGAAQALDVYDPTGWLADAVSGTDIDFRALKEGRVTVYLVIPQDRIATHGTWLGLVTRQAITAVARSAGKTPVLFVLDEFANMGKLAGLAESLTALPGLGVRVWAFVQEMAELVRLYGPNTSETVLSQAEVKQFFAVQNDKLARTLSAALGQRTVKTRSHNLGRFDDDDIGESLGEAGRPLMSPEEIRLMPKDRQLLLISSLPPILAERLPFWFVAPWQDWVETNPVEGDYPRPAPRVTLRYREKAAGAAYRRAAE